MSARGARAALATVYAEGLLGRLAFGMVSFALPLYAAAIGLSLSQIGILISIRTVFTLPFKPVAGWLADRLGMRTVYLGGIVARTVSAVVLLLAHDFAALMLVRVLQGASSAGRDVASLGVIARQADGRVGAGYGRYTAAKYVGTVSGAAAAGLLIAAAGGRAHVEAYRPLFIIVLAMSVVPLVVAWYGLRGVQALDAPRAAAVAGGSTGWREGLAASVRGLAGPGFVGLLVSTSAYMVHGLFPVLATEYAGLTEAQAGVIYSASGLAFVIGAPTFGWLIDGRGRTLGLALRSLCNIGSSLLYAGLPTLGGVAVARVVDDAGKAAFQPAWASVISGLAAEDPVRAGRRLSALDTAGTAGEALGPALATLLWQTGGVALLFAVRIGISVVAEVTALRVFGTRHDRDRARPRRRPHRSDELALARAEAARRR